MTARAWAASLFGDAPLTPSRDQGRQWAEKELSNGEYGGPDPLTRFLRWLSEHLPHGDGHHDAPLWWRVVKVLILLAVLLGVVLVVARTGAVYRRRTTDRARAVLEDDVRSADEHRRAADEHALAGRWAEAVVERFRAVARSLQDRGLVPRLPGITADEVSAEAGAWLPALAADLAAAARTFDDVRYGGAEATRDDDARLRSLDDLLARARPADAPQPLGGRLVVPR